MSKLLLGHLGFRELSAAAPTGEIYSTTPLSCNGHCTIYALTQVHTGRMQMTAKSVLQVVCGRRPTSAILIDSTKMNIPSKHLTIAKR